MTIENDSNCNVRWTPLVIAVVISLGLALLAIGIIAPFGNAAECEQIGKLCSLTGLVAIPIHLLQRINRCRTVITDDGTEFLPARIYGKYSFLWSDVRAWSWVTLNGGTVENAWIENVMELELHQGKTIQIPPQHFHPVLTNTLERHVSPSKHQKRNL